MFRREHLICVNDAPVRLGERRQRISECRSSGVGIQSNHGEAFSHAYAAQAGEQRQEAAAHRIA